ncbi:MAG: hypothetical protein II855_08370, partial [Candidatus Methanomethylophilaceae archaeon]|nr:hypothetical protein [Candidatus Methanomethylophilaceae archaeon]
NPKSTFNCDMLDDNSKIVYYAILGFYYGEDGKADAKNQSDFYGSKYNLKNRNGQHTRDNKILKNRTMIGYYIDKISDKNLIERSPATNKRDKPYVITDIGKIVYEYLSIEMKMSFNIDNNNENGTTGHQDSGGSMKG